MRRISDGAIRGETSFMHYRLQAVMNPRFSAHVEGDFCRKFEYLISCPSPKLILESGSSSCYGLNSVLMEALFEGKYSIVNYGCTAHTSGPFYLEMISHFVGPGDIVIHAPEIDTVQAGLCTFSMTLYRVVEMYYSCFEYVDVGHYTKIFSSLAEFNDVRVECDEPT